MLTPFLASAAMLLLHHGCGAAFSEIRKAQNEEAIAEFHRALEKGNYSDAIAELEKTKPFREQRIHNFGLYSTHCAPTRASLTCSTA